jgi:hypothetical protein
MHTGLKIVVLDDVRDMFTNKGRGGANKELMIAFEEQKLDEALIAQAVKRGVDPKVI